MSDSERQVARFWKPLAIASTTVAALAIGSVVWFIVPFFDDGNEHRTGILLHEHAEAERHDDGWVVGAVFAKINPAAVAADGWLLCDGAVVRKDEYPDLCEIIGDAFSGESVPEGTFRLPDYRGLFFPMFAMAWNGHLCDRTIASAVTDSVLWESRVVVDDSPHATRMYAQVKWFVKAR